MNKANEISDDELKQQEEEIQKLTDKFIAEIDKAIEAKSKEVLTVQENKGYLKHIFRQPFFVEKGVSNGGES